MHSNLTKMALLLAAFSSTGFSQMATGNIGGVVEDSSGAVIANAKVTLVHSATKQTREVTTNERGEFRALLRLGHLRAFKRWILEVQ